MRNNQVKRHATLFRFSSLSTKQCAGGGKGMSAKLLLRALLFPLLWAVFSFAQESGIVLNSNVDKSEITIGDKITYTITVEYPDGGEINLPSVLGNLGSFEVKEFLTPKPEEKGGRIRKSWTFVISTFTIGDYIIPPQVVEYTPAGDTIKITLNTEPIAVLVKRSSPETVKDIADITPLAVIKTKSPVAWTILFILAAAVAAAGLWYWRKRKNRPEKKPPPQPPYEEACEAMNKLRGKTFSEQRDQRILCFSLSAILRRYLSRRFDIDALESTTEEFLQKIQSIKLTRAQRDMAKQFCEKTDPVKFAGLALSKEDQRVVFKWVETLVDQTKPRVIETPDKPEKGKTP